MHNNYTFALSRIKIRSFDSTINSKKDLFIPYTARKYNIFIKKSQKYSFFNIKWKWLYLFFLELQSGHSALNFVHGVTLTKVHNILQTLETAVAIWRPPVWHQSTHNMVAEYVVAKITELTRNWRI